MKAYKVTILIVDHDEVGEGIADEIQNVRYPNHCLHPHVMDIEAVDIGEWTDAHPLNRLDTMRQEYERLFNGVSE